MKKRPKAKCPKCGRLVGVVETVGVPRFEVFAQHMKRKGVTNTSPCSMGGLKIDGQKC